MAKLGVILAALSLCGGTLAAHRAPAAENAGEPGAYELHEWGVFTVPRNAAWANLDMKAEWASLPKGFYGQLPGKELPYRGPVKKPVIYFHAEKPMKLSLTIRFADGLPTVWWPAAEAPVFDGRAQEPEKSKQLCFWPALIERDKPGGRGPASENPRKLEVPAGHWVEILRQVKASDVFCAGSWGRGGESWDTERFIYYDGLMKPPAAPTADRQGAFVTLDVPGAEVWQDLMLIERSGKQVRVAAEWGGWKEALADGAGRHLRIEMKDADEAGLQAISKELAERLVKAGLNPDEAEALVKIWKEGLFDADGLTVFHRVPQETYDKWLPLEAKPPPKRIVRVGLVLHQHLEPELDERVEKLIKQLGAEAFGDREAAQKALLKIGGAAFPLLEKHAADKDAEIATACRSILEDLDARPLLKAHDGGER